MEAEQLVVIAEGLGYDVAKSGDKKYNANGDVIVIKDNKVAHFNPLKDNNQMVEILTKLINLGGLLDSCHIKDENNFMIYFDMPTRVYEGKTINEAVCNAAYDILRSRSCQK